MPDVVSTPPAPASPAGTFVAAGGWWPDISVNRVRETINLGSEIPHARLLEAIRWAVVVVTAELAPWATRHMHAGVESLAALEPRRLVDDTPSRVLLFEAAVGAQAAARLMRRNPDLTATREGSDRGDQRRALADDFLADATRAIRQIQGEPATTSELI